MPHRLLTATAMAFLVFTGAAVAQPAQPPFATRKIDGTDNVYLFRYQGHQSMFIVTPKGVIATDPIGRYRPEAVTAYLAEILLSGSSMFDDPSGPGDALFLAAPRASLASGPGFVVAIPVRDEEERLPACLRALAQQRDRLGQPIPPTLVRVVVFANNCSRSECEPSSKARRRFVARRPRR